MEAFAHIEARFLPYRTAPEITELARDPHATVVAPVASIEQHGPHLPVFTDSLIAQVVLDHALARLPEDCPVWVLPLLAYGKSNEHAGLGGTFTLTSETLIRALKDLAASVATCGFRRLVVFNGHGGNTEIIDFVIRDVREATGLLAFALHPFLHYAAPTEGLSVGERTYGIHAGDVETSILLHAYPELVHWEQAPASLPTHLQAAAVPPFMGPLTVAWLTRDITSTGVIGDATQATAEKGARFLEAAAQQTADLLEKITAFKFDATR